MTPERVRGGPLPAEHRGGRHHAQAGRRQPQVSLPGYHDQYLHRCNPPLLSPTKSQASCRKPAESTRNNSFNGENPIKMIDED